MKRSTKIFLISFLVSVQLIVAQGSITFNSLSNMNEKRYGFGYTTDGQFIYAVCGGIAAPPYFSNTVERYDPVKNEWSIIAKNLILRRYCNAEYIPESGKLYIMNGEYYTNAFNTISNKVEVLDLKNNSGYLAAENPNPVKNAGSAVWNGKIYIFGGQDVYGYTNSFYEYDPTNDKWKKLSDLPERKQTSGKIVDGVLYVFGGYKENVNIVTVFSYDIRKETWTQLEDLPFYLSANAVAVDGKNIWLVGSYLDNDLIASFDTGTKKITRITSNMTSRRHAGAEVLGNSLYVFGGNRNPYAFSALASTEVSELKK